MAYSYKMGFDPLEATGPIIATWVACRAEGTSLPNVLEQDLKSVKCFRLAAKWPIKNFYIAEATLMGCLKKMEAKPHLHLELKPDVVQILIKKHFLTKEQEILWESGKQQFMLSCIILWPDSRR